MTSYRVPQTSLHTSRLSILNFMPSGSSLTKP
jgi:hypothetical protein